MLRAALTLDAVRATFRKKGYAFFDQGDYNLNVFGVRRENMLSDRFDDYLGAVYKDTQRQWHNQDVNLFRYHIFLRLTKRQQQHHAQYFQA